MHLLSPTLRGVFTALTFTAMAIVSQQCLTPVHAQLGAESARIVVSPIVPQPDARSEIRLRSPLLQHQRPPTTFGRRTPIQTAINFATTQLNAHIGEIVVRNSHTTNETGITHVYCKQVIGGIDVANGDIEVHVARDGRVIAYSDSFYRWSETRLRRRSDLWSNLQQRETVAPNVAFKAFADYIQHPIDPDTIQVLPQQLNETDPVQSYLLKRVPFADRDVRVRQSFIQSSEGQLTPAWEYRVHMPRNFFHVYVSSDGKQVISLVDWVKSISSSSYRVVRIGEASPDESPRQLVADPADKEASPYGWHSQGNKTFDTTIGNNVYAQENIAGTSFWENNQRPNGGASLSFDFPLYQARDPKDSRNASITQLFYVCNVMHDISYRYGFTEAAGNFQENNFGKGGLGGDALQANALDGDGTDNADFESPPDGERAKMRMFIFTGRQPLRDGAFENDIVVHEYTHGITNRLTGGPSNVDCLADGQSAGMGEGWSDFFAIWLRMRANDPVTRQMTIGDYVMGSNLRTYPYSTDTTVNPLTYAHLLQSDWNEVHKIGEIWTVTLYEMYWVLVQKLGFNGDHYSADPTKGNTLAMKLVMDALKLQPCRPTFVSARDAILQAEQQLTKGEYRCDLWRAFAKRGLGDAAKAVPEVVASTAMPANCAT